MADQEGSLLNEEEGHFLLSTAREAILARLENRAPRWPSMPAKETGGLRSCRGAFVTLKIRRNGQELLRGCIGRMDAETSLLSVIRDMALAAAFEDPRFPPLAIREYPDIKAEITVLTPLRPIARTQEIQLGRHGVLLHKGWRQAVFLPQVATEQGWNLEELLCNLCLKAGLPPEAWKDPETQLQVFEGQIFEEAVQSA